MLVREISNMGQLVLIVHDFDHFILTVSDAHRVRL
jgi:hypothetical protein